MKHATFTNTIKNQINSAGKKLLFAILLLTICFNSIGQTQTYTGIKRVYSNNLDAIIENKQVVGYYFFYYKEKANRKESVYVLSILDVNLSPTHEIELTKPSNSGLLEGSFNGEVFCFAFVNMKQKTLEYQIIDKKAAIIGSYMVEDVSSSEMQIYANAIQNPEEDTYSGGLMAVDGKGFIRYGIEREGGSRYQIDMIDNNAKKVWSANSGATTKKSFETAQSFYADANCIVTYVSMREKAMSSDINYYLLFSNVADGKDMFKFSTETEKGYLVPMGINYDAEKKGYILYGEYYGKKGSKEKFDLENKMGFFMIELDQAGKMLEEHYVDWKNDITKLIPLNSKGRMEGNYSVYIHNLVKTADGKFFILGEQYKKAASALGIASKGLAVMAGGNSNMSAVKMVLQDMIAFEFDSKFTPKKVYVIEKDHSKILLPNGYGTLPMNTMGIFLKQWGAFDYSFTYSSVDNKTFNSTYVNYDKEKGEGNKFVIGNIVYKNGELKTDHIPLTSKPSAFYVMPGKPGYIVIFEYFRKSKELKVRLEKLDV